MGFSARIHTRTGDGRSLWPVALFMVLTALVSAGCQVESLPQSGCSADDDCAEGRTCLMGVCWWPQDAEFAEPKLLALGRHLLSALQERTYEPLYDNFLSNSDIIELFDYDRSAVVDVISTYDRTLSSDFNDLLDGAPVTGCTVSEVVSGKYVPIPAGTEHTTTGLLRLKNTAVLLVCDGEARSIDIANIVWHLQEWKILTLTSPEMLVQ